MNVIVHQKHRANKKEPLAAMLRRILDGFAAASLTPEVTATFADGPDVGGVSAVNRALKKYPDLIPFVSNEPAMPGLPATQRLAGIQSGSKLPLDAVLVLAEGVPRSLPFNAIEVSFGHPDFGMTEAILGQPLVGVHVGDNWWINGRKRSLRALYTVAADPESSDLPAPPPGVAAVLDLLGTPQKSQTIVMPETADAPSRDAMARVQDITARYRAELADVLDRASLPHDLPPVADVLGDPVESGPLKPTLVGAFTPRDYSCRGEPGRFVLERTTSLGNRVILDINVGTWSRMVTAHYVVVGASGGTRLQIPVCARAAGALQYPIGDGANWERIVSNIAAGVDEYDRTFLVEIEEAIGPSPDWFDPGA